MLDDWRKSLPVIKVDAVPAGDREALRNVEQTLQLMGTFVRSFACTIELFIFATQEAERLGRAEPGSDNHRTVIEWSFIAAREGAMQIWHFHKAVQGAAKTIGNCATLKPHFDPKALEDYQEQLDRDFPRHREIRNAAGHLGELTSTPAEMRRNQAKSPSNMGPIHVGEGAVLLNALLGDEYTTTVFDGDVLSYRVNADTYRKLSASLIRFYGLFEGVAAATRAQK